MSDWAKLNQCRVAPHEDPIFGSLPSEGFNGAFEMRLNGLPILCIASDGEGWQHVSVSIHGTTIPPSWSVMCQVKDLFWEPEDWVVQFHPAHSEYVNNHPGVLHLWRCTAHEFPKPSRLLVGIKDWSDAQKLNQDPRCPYRFTLPSHTACAATADSSGPRTQPPPTAHTQRTPGTSP